GRDSLCVNLRLQLFRAVQMSVADLERPVSVWIVRCSKGVRIERRMIELVSFLIRLAAGENGRIEFKVSPSVTQCLDTVSDVRRVQPVMSDWCFGNFHSGKAVHE